MHLVRETKVEITANGRSVFPSLMRDNSNLLHQSLLLATRHGHFSRERPWIGEWALEHETTATRPSKYRLPPNAIFDEEITLIGAAPESGIGG